MKDLFSVYIEDEKGVLEGDLSPLTSEYLIWCAVYRFWYVVFHIWSLVVAVT